MPSVAKSLPNSPVSKSPTLKPDPSNASPSRHSPSNSTPQPSAIPVSRPSLYSSETSASSTGISPLPSQSLLLEAPDSGDGMTRRSSGDVVLSHPSALNLRPPMEMLELDGGGGRMRARSVTNGTSDPRAGGGGGKGLDEDRNSGSGSKDGVTSVKDMDREFSRRSRASSLRGMSLTLALTSGGSNGSSPATAINSSPEGFPTTSVSHMLPTTSSAIASTLPHLSPTIPGTPLDSSALFSNGHDGLRMGAAGFGVTHYQTSSSSTEESEDSSSAEDSYAYSGGSSTYSYAYRHGQGNNSEEGSPPTPLTPNLHPPVAVATQDDEVYTDDLPTPSVGGHAHRHYPSYTQKHPHLQLHLPPSYSEITSPSATGGSAASTPLPSYNLPPTPSTGSRLSFFRALNRSKPPPSNLSTSLLPSTSDGGSSLATTSPSLLPSLILLAGSFAASLAIVSLLVISLPSLSIPHNLEEVIGIFGRLEGYQNLGWWEASHTVIVLSGLFTFKQAYSIPGSILMNVLLGALYGTWPATILSCWLTACGSLGAYELARGCGPLVEYYFPSPLALTRRSLPASVSAASRQAASTSNPSQLSPSPANLGTANTSSSGTTTSAATGSSTGDLTSYLLLARFFPLLPYSVLNVVSGVLLIPRQPFFWTLVIGSFPYNFCTTEVGEVLGKVAKARKGHGINGPPTNPPPAAEGPGGMPVPPIEDANYAYPEDDGFGSNLADISSSIWTPDLFFKLIMVTCLSVLPLLFKSHLQRLITAVVALSVGGRNNRAESGNPSGGSNAREGWGSFFSLGSWHFSIGGMKMNVVWPWGGIGSGSSLRLGLHPGASSGGSGDGLEEMGVDIEMLDQRGRRKYREKKLKKKWNKSMAEGGFGTAFGFGNNINGQTSPATTPGRKSAKVDWISRGDLSAAQTNSPTPW